MATKSIHASQLVKLKGEQNLEQWKLILEASLNVHKLSTYIEADVPKPEIEGEKKKWRTERNIVSLLIKQTLTDDSVYQTLMNNGWDPSEKNPYITYSKVLRAVPKISPEAEFDLYAELATMKRQRIFDKP